MWRLQLTGLVQRNKGNEGVLLRRGTPAPTYKGRPIKEIKFEYY